MNLDIAIPSLLASIINTNTYIQKIFNIVINEGIDLKVGCNSAIIGRNIYCSIFTVPNISVAHRRNHRIADHTHNYS